MVASKERVSRFARQTTKQLTPAAITIVVLSIVFGRDIPVAIPSDRVLISNIAAVALISAWMLYLLSAALGARIWFFLNADTGDEPSDQTTPSNSASESQQNAEGSESDKNSKGPTDDEISEKPGRRIRSLVKLQIYTFILATFLLVMAGISSLAGHWRVQAARDGGSTSISTLTDCQALKNCISQTDFDLFFANFKLSPTLKTELENIIKNELKVVLEGQLSIKAEIEVVKKVCAQRCNCGRTCRMRRRMTNRRRTSDMGHIRHAYKNGVSKGGSDSIMQRFDTLISRGDA